MHRKFTANPGHRELASTDRLQTTTLLTELSVIRWDSREIKQRASEAGK